jgi:hypothetical protein
MKPPTVCALVFLFVFTIPCQGGEVDHGIFDFRKGSGAEAWSLNIFGTNDQGVKKGGAGSVEAVAGRWDHSKALRFSSTDAGSYNFISPDLEGGDWRKRQYFGMEIRYRGDGSAGMMDIKTVTEEGQYSIALRFDGTGEWKTEIHRSGWARKGTPPINWSKLLRLYVSGSGTRHVDIESITLVGGLKPIYLEETVSGKGEGSEAPPFGLSDAGLYRLDEKAQSYHFRGHLKGMSSQTVGMRGELILQPEGGEAVVVSRKPIATSGPGGLDLGVPFDYQPKKEGRQLLSFLIRDSKDAVLWKKEYGLVLTTPRKRDDDAIVLWPRPQIWEPGDKNWSIPEEVGIRTSGEGDAFPAEHLASQLKSRYGVGLRDTPGGADAEIRLEFVQAGVEPEGFVLHVDESGVSVKASSSRGMYYGVRALLDLARQSSFGEQAAGIRHVHCRDWPDIPTRVYMDFFISERYHKTPLTVEAFQKHIYEQIAGGRYNLYIMQLNEHMRYDSHPELAPGNCFSKEQVREIVRFAKKHYVDIAPGWNTPGHAAWIVRGGGSELAEDGDPETLCTSHPEGMKTLKDISRELVELFEPKYFHMGGDEVSQGWQRAGKRICKRCAGRPRKELMLEHWSELAGHIGELGVRPILFDDMLSVRWNGGAPDHCSEILEKLPRKLIISTWSMPPLPVPTEHLRELGFTPWSIQTGFQPVKMDALPAVWKKYESFGIAETSVWIWTNFTHAEGQVNYSTPALHANAACAWKPLEATMGQDEMLRVDGARWSNTMEVPNWGERRMSYHDLVIPGGMEKAAPALPGDGRKDGGKDNGLQGILDKLPKGRLAVGKLEFSRPEGGFLAGAGEEESQALAIGRKVLGFAFAHTAVANDQQIAGMKAVGVRQKS